LSNVVSFIKPPEGPYIQGRAKCLDCKNEWEAVGPVGTLYLVCPMCETKRGVMIAPIGAVEGQDEWTCRCGCDLFKIIGEARKFKWMLCLRCGTPQDF
jgi:hypothetical protein